jgi:D-alanyl-D-alanine carboxypeptidase
VAVSQNGYRANDLSRTRIWAIPGADRRVRLRKGPPGRLLVQLAGWFHQWIEPIDEGQLDDWGYAARPIRGSVTLSNHASGTAIDLNALRHPLGVRGTFTRRQVTLIHHKLADLDFCVRWGGDFEHRADEMHWEIIADVARCRRALRH